MDHSEKATKIRNSLLEWYEKNQNNHYPWRKTSDLYQILITEILLQKTIASNVLNIYTPFFKKYTGFKAILNTPLEELKSDIKQLGLSNKRSQILKDLSKLIIDEYKGTIPQDPEVLKQIKGIADYVSNAYLCFGLNKRTLFYDVNIKRFISRIFTQNQNESKIDFFKESLNFLLPDSDVKSIYWAILDFGSKICTKTNPLCNQCPVSKYCKYYSKD
ncbi:MAG: hypothetical protein GF383_11270 [Candidatus Lokiarchaeota archaeon]|nr:hypothetical protein [Candidatus Lokiarchaeota archaeon]MBD3341295.1 hypothetical protein [Candidatus Lokiarchaeota archaeon]